MLERKTVLLSEVKFDESIYPRKAHDPAKVQEYAANMEAIEAKENFIGVSLSGRLLDGRHRHLAYLKNAKGEDHEIIVFVHPVDGDNDEYLLSCELNNSHGQQLSLEDKATNAAKMYTMGFTIETICARLAISKPTANRFTKGNRDDENKRRDDLIREMWQACYTQDEITEAVADMDISEAAKLSQRSISTKTETFSSLDQMSQTAKSRLFEHDQNFTPPLYNVWTFAKKTNEVSHFGNSEKRIVDNLVYLYTEPFDIVLDPFAGGGSTIDVCKHRSRRYWVSDRAPIIERAGEIRQHDLTDGVPPLNKLWSDVSLTYLDPPYWKQAAGQYSDDATDLANMELDEFTKTLAGIVKEIAKRQKTGRIALIIQPTQWLSDDRAFSDHVLDLIKAVGKLTVENRISVPYSTEQYNAQQVNWAKENHKLLVLTREVIVWNLS